MGWQLHTKNQTHRENCTVFEIGLYHIFWEWFTYPLVFAPVDKKWQFAHHLNRHHTLCEGRTFVAHVVSVCVPYMGVRTPLSLLLQAIWATVISGECTAAAVFLAASPPHRKYMGIAYVCTYSIFEDHIIIPQLTIRSREKGLIAIGSNATFLKCYNSMTLLWHLKGLYFCWLY